MSAPEKQPEIRPTWEEVREALRETVNRREETTFARWFEPVTGSVEDGKRGAFTLRLVAPSPFHADWLKKDYLHVIEMVWRQFAPEGEVILTAQQKAETKAKALQPKPKGEVVQLSLFPKETRPFSNDMIRSGLFAAVQGKNRKTYTDYHKIATFGDTEIWLKGKQFNQDDHDCLAEMVFGAHHKPLGQDVQRPFRSFVKSLGRGYGSNVRQSVTISVDLLISNTIKIKNRKLGLDYIGHLVNDGALPSDKFDMPRLERDFSYFLNPKLATFYTAMAYTLVDWEQRKSLGQQDLGRWLQLWVNSNAEYFPVKVETLLEKCGNQTKHLRSFRQQLRKALSRLEEQGIIGAWFIEKKTDLVHLTTKPSPSQQRHLEKAKKRRK